MNYSQYIRDAMIAGRVLRISFADATQTARTEIVRPLQWVGAQRFIALNDETQEELIYEVSQIQYCQSFSTIEQARAYDKRSEPVLQPPPVPIKLSTAPDLTSWLNVRANRLVKIHQVGSSSDWQHLLQYFLKCLEQQRLKQTVIKTNELFAFPLGAELLEQFFQAKIGLEFARDSDSFETISQFITENPDLPGSQLCLGYPFMIFNQDQAAPFVFTRVRFTKSPELILLLAEKIEISAAPMRLMQFSEEKIASLIHHFGNISANSTLVNLDELVQAIADAEGISASVKIDKLTDAIQNRAIFNRPGFFRVDFNEVENDLIPTLRALNTSQVWQYVPESLRQLLAGGTREKGPRSPGAFWVEETFGTPIQPDLQAALAAGMSEPLSLVITQNGAAKADLIFHLIVQSFLAGQSVLYSGPNLLACGSAVERLLANAGFGGVMFAAPTQLTETAVENLAIVLEHKRSSAVSPFAADLKDCTKTREEYLHADENIEKVRNFDRLQDVFVQQRAKLTESLSEAWLPISEFTPGEQSGIESLLAEIEALYGLAQDQLRQYEEFVVQLGEAVCDNQTDSILVENLQNWAEPTGASDASALFRQDFSGIADLSEFVQVWLLVIAQNNNHYQQNETSQALSEARTQLDEFSEKLWPSLPKKIEPLANQYPEKFLEDLSSQFRLLAEQFIGLAERKTGIAEQLAGVSTFFSPLNKLVNTFDQAIHTVGLSWPPKNRVDPVGVQEYALAAAQMANLLMAADSRKKIDRLQALNDHLMEQTEALLRRLPDELRDFIRNYSPTHIEKGGIAQTLDELRGNLDRLKAEAAALRARIRENLEENRLHIPILVEIWTRMDVGDVALHLDEAQTAPDSLIEILEAWSDLAQVLQLNSLLAGIKEQRGRMPVEDDLIAKKLESPQRMGELNRKILHLTWLERIWQMPERILQKVVTFLAMKEEALSGRTSRSDLPDWRVADLEVIDAALKIFTGWLSTFDQVQSLQPLKPGMFDMVIIDEAERVDLPSALPVLFRGKRAVLIAQAEAVERMTWITQLEDQAYAKENGIAYEAYSFKRDTLLDLARRNLKNHPKAVFVIGEDNENHGRAEMQTNPAAAAFVRLTLPVLLDSCREFIWWIDPDFDNEVVTLFWDLLQQDKMIPLNEIRLLVSSEQVNKPDVLHLNSLKALQAEMEDFGIQFEIRKLAKAELPDQRTFFSGELALVMPEFNEVYRNRHLLHDFEQLAVPFGMFELYWGKAKPVL